MGIVGAEEDRVLSVGADPLRGILQDVLLRTGNAYVRSGIRGGNKPRLS